MKLNSVIKSHKQEGGFTLIEMSIVVTIIAILVAIAVPALNTAKADAQSAKRDSALAAIATAKIRYALKTDGVEGQTATLAQIQPYLLVNGVAVNNVNDLLKGTGRGNVTYGTYPNTDGSSTAATLTP